MVGRVLAPYAVKEYTEHYHQERNHQGLDNELIEKVTAGPKMDGTVACRERLSITFFDL